MCEQPTKSRSVRRYGDRGVALIEFSLVLPLLAMLVVGLFSSAVLYDARMSLTHATREGARYGATIPVDQTFVSGNWATNVRDLVIEREGGNLAEQDVCVALVAGTPPAVLSVDHTTEPAGGPCFDDSASGETSKRVQVLASRTTFFDAVAFSRDVTSTARATARHESND